MNDVVLGVIGIVGIVVVLWVIRRAGTRGEKETPPNTMAGGTSGCSHPIHSVDRLVQDHHMEDSKVEP